MITIRLTGIIVPALTLITISQQSVTPEQLLKEADRCVKCGLCLPHCPTYRELANEADSPRGRIALIQALARGELSPTPTLRLHLSRCLNCRACETACPSGVSYGELIDAAHAMLQQSAGIKRPLRRALLNLLSERKLFGQITRLLPLLSRSGVLRLIKKTPSKPLRQLADLASVMPAYQPPPSGLTPATTAGGGSVQLFIGCISSQVDRPVIDAAIRLLTHMGFAVNIPKQQVCCGALHRHNGFPQAADRLSELNSGVFVSPKPAALITLAEACHKELLEQTRPTPRLQTISAFLLNTPWPETFHFTPLKARVAVHRPCSASEDSPLTLLQRIPGLIPFLLPENAICCGGAGSYPLTQPALAQSLGETKIALLRETKADILVTSSTGCTLQFRTQIKRAGLDIEVLHPVELLTRQLDLNSQSDRLIFPL